MSPKTCQKSAVAFVPFGGLRMFRAPIDRFFCTLGSFLMVEGCSLLGGRTAKRWCYAGHNKLPKRFHWQSTVFENYSKCRIWILTIFCSIKMSGNTVYPSECRHNSFRSLYWMRLFLRILNTVLRGKLRTKCWPLQLRDWNANGKIFRLKGETRGIQKEPERDK